MLELANEMFVGFFLISILMSVLHARCVWCYDNTQSLMCCCCFLCVCLCAQYSFILVVSHRDMMPDMFLDLKLLEVKHYEILFCTQHKDKVRVKQSVTIRGRPNHLLYKSEVSKFFGKKSITETTSQSLTYLVYMQAVSTLCS